ncbi:MAG: hypothetical protein KDA25_08555 [Phycisphaerales bacterium]|nr:hypothetical protein [Phycisphaerales bacterium]
MSRISIDVTPEQHQRLKALAALCGKSIKEFVLDRTLGEPDAGADLAELEALLDRRIADARTRGASTRTVGDVFTQARHELSVDG